VPPLPALVSAPVNSCRPPGSCAGTSQPRECSASSWACESGSVHGPAGSAERASPSADAAPGRRVGEADVDEHVLADHVGGRVEDLPLERQLGRVVEPEPGGDAAVGAPGLDHLGGPVIRRAGPRVRHHVMLLEQLQQRRGNPEDALGGLAVGVGGQVGLAAERGARIQGPGHRLPAADVPDVGYQDAPATAVPAGDDLFALVGSQDRRLGGLGQQPDGTGSAGPPGRRGRPARGRGPDGRRHGVVLRRARARPGLPAARDQDPGHGNGQRDRQQQRRPAVTTPGNQGEHAGPHGAGASEPA
jgi:hypothetical protein